MLLRHKVDRALLQEREKHCLIIYTLEGERVYTGQELGAISAKDFEQPITNTREVRGIGASSGKVVGKVRLVVTHQDIAKVKK